MPNRRRAALLLPCPQMNHVHSWIYKLGAIAVAAMLGSLEPAAAESISTRAIAGAKPEPIVVVERQAEQLTRALTAEEVKTLKHLQAAQTPILISETSPDESTVVIKVHDGIYSHDALYLLNLLDGSKVPIQIEGFKPPEFHWQDDQTLVGIRNAGRDQIELVKVDRATGRSSITTVNLPGFLWSVSPDASRVLVQVSAAGAASSSSQYHSAQRSQSTEFKVVDLASGEEQYRFSIPAESLAGRVSWTPDSAKVALVVSAQLTPTLGFGDGALLSSTQTRDAMGVLPPPENPLLQKNRLITIDLTTREQRVLHAVSGDGGVFAEASWSPDGQTLLVRLDYPTRPEGRLYPSYGFSDRSVFRFYDADLQPQQQLTDPQLNNALVRGRFVSAHEVLFNALIGMDIHLYLYNVGSDELHQLSQQPGVNGAFNHIAIAPKARQVVFSHSSYSQPPELYQMNLDEGEAKAITQFNESIAQLSQIRADAVSFDLPTGETLNGVLLQPADAAFPPRNKPLIVWQPGGPFNEVLNQWSATVERPLALLPNFDFAVLVVPLQGRLGFGPDRFRALADGDNFGQVDVDAMAEIVQQAIDRGYTSSDQVGITGCSYGGYFAAQSVARHPGLYAAANPQCAVIDFVMEWTRGYPTSSPYLFGALTPYSNPAEFQQASPIYNTAQIQTPTLIFHGSNDFLPVAINENFYYAIAAQGVPARMIKFTGAGHGLSSNDGIISDYQVYAAQEMIQWFRQYLDAPVQAK